MRMTGLVSMMASVALFQAALLISLPGAHAHEGTLGTLGCHTDREAGDYHCHEGSLAGRVFPSRKEAIEILARELKARRLVKGRPAPAAMEKRQLAPVGKAPPEPEQRLPLPKPIPKLASSPKELTTTQVFRQVSPSVYILLAYRGALPNAAETPFSQGSAVAVSTELALTNCHVIKGAGRATLFKDGRHIPVHPHLIDAKADRCVVRAGQDLAPIRHIKGFDDLKVGQKVYSVGSPNGLENTLGEGLLSGKRSPEGFDLLQTSAPISPGSSGGGLFDTQGNLIGITTFMLKDSQNLNFALPVEGFLDQLSKKQAGVKQH